MAGKYDKLINDLMIVDRRLHRAFACEGLKPCEIQYELVSDEQMVQLGPYVMMPADYRHWSKGKSAIREKQNAKFMHVYEAVINSDPSIEYLSLTNSDAMNYNVQAHAGAHVDFFANNELFKQTSPKTIIARFAQGKRIIDDLIRDPDWGWEGVESILDAAHAIEVYSGWLNVASDGSDVATKPGDKEMREARMEEAREIKRRILGEGQLSVALKASLEHQMKVIEAELKRFPLTPTGDLTGILMDKEFNPQLSEEARSLISIVRDRARYFQPQGRTKFMNEGWASFWEKWALLHPHMDLPADIRFDLLHAWSMHDRMATNWYFDPYAFGLRVFEYLDRKYGFDMPEVELKVPVLNRDENGWMRELKRTKKVKWTPRNRDKIMQVRRQYDDSRFIGEFMNEELFEQINTEALGWTRRVARIINDVLKKGGWGENLHFDPLPITIEEMMQVVQTWMQAQQMADQYHQWAGTPRFPVPPETLQAMGTVLQIVAAFDEDKHKARRSLQLRTGYNSLPNIKCYDTGRYSDGVWTLKHEFDPTFGPLLQSECKDTLKYFYSLLEPSRPVRLLTMEIRTDWRGQPVGPPIPYEYFTEDGDLVKERALD